MLDLLGADECKMVQEYKESEEGQETDSEHAETGTLGSSEQQCAQNVKHRARADFSDGKNKVGLGAEPPGNEEVQEKRLLVSTNDELSFRI